MPNAWFRMYTDFLDDAKMMQLAFEDQRHFIGVLALKSAGTIEQYCTPDVMDRIVAQKLWIDMSAIKEVKRRLMDADLIADDWQPLAWDKRQFVSDHDISGAERQRRYREKQRNALRNVTGNALRNGPVTLPDTDTDTDTEEKKKGPKRAARFRPPTLEQVSEYCRERGNTVSPQKFIDHYTGNGWMRGKTKIKDWRAVIRTWEQNENENRTRTGHNNRNGSVSRLKRIADEDDPEKLGGAAVSEAQPGLRQTLDGTYRRN